MRDREIRFFSQSKWRHLQDPNSQPSYLGQGMLSIVTPYEAIS